MPSRRSGEHRLGTLWGLVWTGCLTALCLAAAVVHAWEEPDRAPHLLYLEAEKDWPGYEAAAECDRLTIAEYRKRGTKVTVRGYGDLEKWLEGEGKPLAKAIHGLQAVGYAKAHQADAVGGLDYWEITEEEAKEYGEKPGVSFFSWGTSLSGLCHKSYIDLQHGVKIRPIPLDLLNGNEADKVWTIPLKVAPLRCLVEDATLMLKHSSNRGRPFLGLVLDGQKVVSVWPESPAKKAGLQPNDLIISVAEHPVQNQDDLGVAIERLSPGDEAVVKFQRNESSTEERVRLADYFEAVEAKAAHEGKRIPNLVAKDINGKEVRLRDFRGKVVLLEFWATWCGPCMQELPLLQLLWERVEDKDLAWIGVSVDEDERKWREFVQDNKLGGIQLRSQEWADSLFILGYPTIYLIGRDGIVQCQVYGESIAAATLALLSEQPGIQFADVPWWATLLVGAAIAGVVVISARRRWRLR